jgi:hypothetical protein
LRSWPSSAKRPRILVELNTSPAATLAGDVLFRFELSIGRLRWRASVALPTVAATPVGIAASPLAESSRLLDAKAP